LVAAFNSFAGLSGLVKSAATSPLFLGATPATFARHVRQLSLLAVFEE